MMTWEICSMYRNAKSKYEQLQILAELNNTSRTEIMRILVNNGEKLPARAVNQLYARLDVLEGQIIEKEREYREIMGVLEGGKASNE